MTPLGRLEQTFTVGKGENAATYTLVREGIRPWRVTRPDGTQLEGEWGQRFDAVAAVRADYSHTASGAGRARFDEYVRSSVKYNRRTGTAIRFLDLDHPDREQDEEVNRLLPRASGTGRWATQCVDHATLARWPAYRHARDEARKPPSWCHGCAQLAGEAPGVPD